MSSKTRNGLSCSEAGKIGYEKSKDKLALICQQRKNIYNTNPKVCLQCNKLMEYTKKNNKFCSRSCAASYNNMGICRVKKTYNENIILTNRKIYKNYVKKEKLFCLYCSKELTKNEKKFCSNRCYSDYKWKLTKEKIEKRKAVDLNAIANSKVARRYLKEIRGVRCEICGITEWRSKEVPLVLDHIDGNPINWKLDNLRLICGNCDMQTDTYKGKNRGHGRFSRRLRYRTGKSY